jgi:phosphate-selective porin
VKEVLHNKSNKEGDMVTATMWLEKTDARRVAEGSHRLVCISCTAFALFAVVVSVQAQSNSTNGSSDSAANNIAYEPTPVKDAPPPPTSLTPLMSSAGNITFTPGLRVQPRYAYDAIDKNNDFFIRRVRLKGKGTAFDFTDYYFEVKIDNVGQFNSRPNTQVENAWLNFPIHPDVALRVGLYDLVYDRNALTSDSKLLFLERSLITSALTGLGLADNTVGVLAHGRPMGGRFSYGFGIFDNLGFEVAGSATEPVRKADGAMTTGRFVYDFLDPATPGGYADYQSSYLGKGKRLSLGVNGAYLSKVRLGSNELDLYAWGGDLFFNSDAVTVEAEYNRYIEDVTNGGTPTLKGDGWYAQGGYLLFPTFELAARYQELDANHNDPNDKLRWTSLGCNIYLRGHNLKIQAEYIFKNEQTANRVDNDLFQVQVQLDF